MSRQQCLLYEAVPTNLGPACSSWNPSLGTPWLYFIVIVMRVGTSTSVLSGYFSQGKGAEWNVAVSSEFGVKVGGL